VLECHPPSDLTFSMSIGTDHGPMPSTISGQSAGTLGGGRLAPT
jgi:hypothetical protein